MPETEADPGRPPRFPYAAALLCGACVGATAWLWMACSYAWDVTPKDILEALQHWLRERRTAIGQEAS